MYKKLVNKRSARLSVTLHPPQLNDKQLTSGWISLNTGRSIKVI